MRIHKRIVFEVPTANVDDDDSPELLRIFVTQESKNIRVQNIFLAIDALKLFERDYMTDTVVYNVSLRRILAGKEMIDSRFKGLLQPVEKLIGIGMVIESDRLWIGNRNDEAVSRSVRLNAVCIQSQLDVTLRLGGRHINPSVGNTCDRKRKVTHC